MRRLVGLLTALVAIGSLAALPASAALPVGEASVTIAGFTGGITATPSIAVQLHLVWPSGAEQVSVGNGDGATQTLPVADVLDWQLVPLGDHEASATRTVVVTFTGPSVPATTSTDTIVLDSRAPRIPRQRLFANGGGWFLAVKTDDAGTGVRSIALLGRTGRPLQTTDTCPAEPCPPSTVQTYFAERARPRVLRVTDGAGNAKAKTLVRRATSCSPPDGSFPVFIATDRFYDCVAEGDRCRRDDGHFWARSAYVRCREVDGKLRVVVRK